TYIANERVGEKILQHGDEIVLGATHLVYFEINEAAASLNRVTIAPNAVETMVRAKVDAVTTGNFLPGKQLADAEVLRRDYEELRIAHELNRAIVGVLDLEQLMPKILKKAFELLPADRGVLLMPDDSGKMEARYVEQKSGVRNDQILISKSILAEVEQH